MTLPAAFPSKWHFVFATVLIAVHRRSGVFFGTQSEKVPMLCVWTTDEGASGAVAAADFELKVITVRDLLGLVPEDIGILVDPGLDGGMSVASSVVAGLKRYALPFPPGTRCEFTAWVGLPTDVRREVVANVSGRSFVDAVWALLYTIDDSPYVGCLVYRTRAGREGQESTVAAVRSALDRSTSRAALDVAAVNIVGDADLPSGVCESLPAEARIWDARSGG